MTDPTTPTVATLWLDVLGRLASPVAHEVNNALNSVAVNLAVVQTRVASASPADGWALERVAPFADRAAEHLDAATRLLQSVLWLARPVPNPVDPRAVLDHLIPIAEAARCRIELAGVGQATSVAGDVVRLSLAAALTTLGAGTVSHVIVSLRDDATAVRIEGAGLPAAVSRIAEGAGITVHAAPDHVSLIFPPVSPAA